MLPALADAEPEQVSALLGEHRLTEVDHTRLTELAIQDPHRIRAWFPSDKPNPTSV